MIGSRGVLGPVRRLGFVSVCAALLAVAVAAQEPAWEQAVAQGDEALERRQFDRAQQFYQQALNVPLGDNDPRRAQTLMRLARLHRAQGDLAKPETIYRQADPLARAAWGPDSPEYAAFLTEVGRYYHRRRKYDLAERFYMDSFGIRVRAFGKEHVEVADSLNNLAILFENQARLDKSRLYYEYALKIRETELGSEHPRTVETLEHFARLLSKLQQHNEARELLERARQIRRPLLDEMQGERVDLGMVYSIRPGVRSPEPVEQVEPEYTDEARLARHEGSVSLEVEIDKEGVPRNVRVVRMLGLGLDEKAIEAVRQWRFRPARAEGARVPFRAVYEINFSLL